MITKFLYQLDMRSKKVIVGVVEDENPSLYDPSKRFMLVDSTKAINTQGDRVTLNTGKQGYIVFHTEDGLQYLDINVFNGEVSINITKNIKFAASYSEEFFEVILDYVEYFGYDDVEFIYNGLKKSKLSLDDDYDFVFKRITDSSYCKINKDNKAYFVAKGEDDRYYLSESFSLAYKMNKADIRKILVINKFIDKATKKEDISFSPLKALTSDNSYYYAGQNPFKATYCDDTLKIELEPAIDLHARLIKSEEIFLGLKDVSYLLGKEKLSKTYYLEVNNKYVKKNEELSYSFVNNPYEATLLIDYDIEIIKSLLKVFDNTKTTQRRNKNYFMYYTGNLYELYDKPLPNFDNGRMIDDNVYGLFTTTFNMSFNNQNRENGIILIRDGKYLSIEMKSNTSFTVNLTDSSYNASIFTPEEATSLEYLFNWNFKRREIINNLNNLSYYNIIYDKKKSIIDEYKDIMKEITSKKTTVVGYDKPSNIRCETEKGALEYLRRFYIKDILDYKELFRLSLNDNVKNILIVSSKFNLELQGLSLATNNKINVTILNENKFGYLPHIYLNDNIKINAMYRLKLQNLPKSFINNFDMIVFGQAFDEEMILFKDNLDLLLNDNKNMIFVNSRHAKFEAPYDKFYDYFSTRLDLKRKYFTYDIMYKDEVLKFDEDFQNYLYKIQSIYQFPSVKLDKEYSYHSIIIKNGNELIDYYKK
ncbi:MAG: hypothetical protein ACI35W_00380 [Anaeroplasmataceae bacterium]